MNDTLYMSRAVTLAKLASGHTSPNPLVGAVVVKDNTVIGEGYHHKAGEAHAEVNAIRNARESVQGATLYVTLEPCAHYGRTPPCALQIVESGISRVVIGSSDPNPLVAGKGIEILLNAGVSVTTKVMEEECLRLNEAFFKYIQTKEPFVILKSAMSLDGKIGTCTGESQWITNETARKDGHLLRAVCDAIVVGIGTILADDPILNCRLSPDELFQAVIGDDSVDNTMTVHQPDVVILDSLGRTPTDAKVFSVENRKVIILVSAGCTQERRHELTQAGAVIFEVRDVKKKADIHVDNFVNAKTLDILQALSLLGDHEYMSILVEGGAGVISSFVENLAFDKIVTYIGNSIIGGVEGIPAVGGNGFKTLDEAPKLDFRSVQIVDNNIRIEAYRSEREGLCSQA